MDAFAGTRTWIFDLDHTLYPPEAQLFTQIERRMTAWIMRELRLDRDSADALRRDYWQRHGSTLAGLIHNHGIRPVDYLAEVHDIALDALTPDPTLAARIAALPGRRIVFTNGPAAYAERVLAARGMTAAFHAVYGIEQAGFLSKPDRAAFDAIARRDGHHGADAAMFEDTAANLLAPHAMGMRTVHVAQTRGKGAHIHHHAPDLAAFLSQIVD